VLAREEADAELLRGSVAGPRPPREQRIHGLNACLAMFARRPGDLRKVWLLESRIPALKAVLAHCVQHRLGYTVVGDEDLRKLSGSEHHEGVVFGVVPAPEQNLSEWLRTLPPGPQLAIWLDGVGNPHNLGAILRSAAHFGAAGLLLPKDSPLALSGAAARVAEGGAEQVPLVRLGRGDNSLAQLASAGFQAVATVVRGGESLYAGALPGRLLLVMGAEQSGLDPALAAAAARRVGIPGSGAVESLNVASATAVFLGEWWRQHRAG
jgi:TrmH RNA methyltransferase